MRGIRFIQELSKEFKIPFRSISWVCNLYLFKSEQHIDIYIRFRAHRIVLNILYPNETVKRNKFKCSEKYKIKQLIHEVLCEELDL